MESIRDLYRIELDGPGKKAQQVYTNGNFFRCEHGISPNCRGRISNKNILDANAKMGKAVEDRVVNFLYHQLAAQFLIKGVGDECMDLLFMRD
jgi:hypothetical protein